MRDYSKVGPQFWNGKTGKALKEKGSEAVIVALYLMTCQHANMLGLYYLHKAYIAVDTGLGLEGACKGLAGAIEAGFCHYDEASEVVWVVEMAAYQVGERLDPKDLRCKGVQREYDALQDNPFLALFYERYGAALHMSACRGDLKPLASPLQTPCKPGAGTGAGEETGAGDPSPGAVLPPGASPQKPAPAPKPTPAPAPKPAAAPARPPAAPAAPKEPAPTAATWDAYSAAYLERYGVEPVRNAHVNGQLAQFVTRVPGAEAPLIAAFYVKHENGLYRNAQHPVNLLLRDAESLRTQWATGQANLPPARRGPLSAEEQASESRRKAERILAARNATGGAVVPASEVVDG
jgi:hypothetical protein